MWTKKPYTEDLLNQHLEGERTYGVSGSHAPQRGSQEMGEDMKTGILGGIGRTPGKRLCGLGGRGGNGHQKRGKTP